MSASGVASEGDLEEGSHASEGGLEEAGSRGGPQASSSRQAPQGVEWSGVEWSGVEWSGVEWEGVPRFRGGGSRKHSHEGGLSERSEASLWVASEGGLERGVPSLGSHPVGTNSWAWDAGQCEIQRQGPAPFIRRRVGPRLGVAFALRAVVPYGWRFLLVCGHAPIRFPVCSLSSRT